ncbi:MAG: hypothetical protein ACE5J7_02015 [Candidatus Aenigmatarchaeota archaeon]
MCKVETKLLHDIRTLDQKLKKIKELEDELALYCSNLRYARDTNNRLLYLDYALFPMGS